MRFLKFFTLCGLLAAGLTSCVEDTVDLITPSVEEPAVDEPTASTNFVVGAENVDFDHAYLNTRREGRYAIHTLVLTVGEVHEGNDLTGTTNRALEVRFKTDGPNPVGTFAGGSGTRVGDLFGGGYRQNYNFSQAGSSTVGGSTIRAGMLEVSKVDGQFVFDLDLTVAGLDVKGKYDGATEELSGLPEGAGTPVTDADFEGTPGITVAEGERPLTNAYLKKLAFGRGYELFLATSEIDQIDNTLIGTGDAMMFRFVRNGEELTTGRYGLHSRYAGGYFGRFIQRDQSLEAYFCRQINFVTGSMQDDEPMGGGEAIIQTDGETFRASFTFQSTRGNTVKGLFEGPVLDIEN